MPALLAFAVLIGLGTWQIQRKAWKEGLIATLTARVAQPPQALPAADTLGEASIRRRDEYRRVKFSAEFDNDKEALVFAAAFGIPARRLRRRLLGLYAGAARGRRVRDGQSRLRARRRQDPKPRPEGEIAGSVEIVGALRWPDDRHWFTPADDPGA